MQVTLHYGQQNATFNIDENRLVTAASNPGESLDDLSSAMRHALDHPTDIPSLNCALTPDDHIAVVVDERLPQLSALLVPLLEYLVEVGIKPNAITLLCVPPTTQQPWLADLPDELDDIVCEVHDPENDKKISYLATTGEGRRLYFNRSLVDADQIIVLSSRRYDPFLGHDGAAGLLYPTFSNQETIKEHRTLPTLEFSEEPKKLYQDAIEASWLLGAPFFVQVIDGPGGGVAEIVTGLAGSIEIAEQRQDHRWRRTVPQSVDTIIASVNGEPDLESLAQALTGAVRALKADGSIVLLTETDLQATQVLQLLQRGEDPRTVIEAIDVECATTFRAAWEWASVAEQARIYLLSDCSPDLVEDLFAVPLSKVSEAQRLVDRSGACLFVDDVDKTLLVREG